MKTLFLIPARGGSKGIPKKNIKLLNGKPLINYAIDLARCFVKDEDICLSTDSKEIESVAKQNNLYVPFLRPENLSSDTAGTREVILHAIEYYESIGIQYDTLVLLQPTSPFRLKKHLDLAFSEFEEGVDQVVSVSESRNPLYVYSINNVGFLERFISNSSYERRQDIPKAYIYNGALYIFRISALKKNKFDDLKKTKPIIMDEISSIDIDKPIDFKWAEFLIQNQLIKFDF